QPDTPIPANLTVPSGNCFKILLYGRGVQIYQCVTSGSSGSWSQVGPDAYLINNNKTENFTSKFEVAHHYFQQTPVNGGIITWQSLVKGDNSLVIAKKISQSPSPDGPENVPWLETQTTSNQGEGTFSNITYVLRINTKGGVAPPATQCGTTYSNGRNGQKSEFYLDHWPESAYNGYAV
ncbi:19784_t:CDS:2, partial [Dentiscutata erythropus]